MAFVAILGNKVECDRKTKVRNEWKRMRRIDGERRENRKDVAAEKIVQI